MKRLINNLLLHHLLPLLLLPVAMSGCFCFAILRLPEALRSNYTPDRVIAVIFSSFGILGTIATVIFLRAIRRRTSTWRVFELGRTAWIVLIGFAWIAGLACGVVMLYETSG